MSSSRSRLASASVEAAPSVEAGGANGSLGARAQLRQRLAGLSYDEQVALVRPSHPGSPNAAQVQMMGSAMMVTSSGAQEVTRVGVFTPALAKALEENDDASLDQILRETAGTVMTEGSEAHPTLAELGELTSPLDPERTPSLMATGVANSRYSGIGAVPSWKEAEPFMAALSGRGFDTELHQDLTAPEMGSRYDAAFAKAQPGDQVVVSYVGHGDTGVLIGVEHQWPVGAVDELPYERLINASAAAVKRGAHVRLIPDSPPRKGNPAVS